MRCTLSRSHRHLSSHPHPQKSIWSHKQASCASTETTTTSPSVLFSASFSSSGLVHISPVLYLIAAGGNLLQRPAAPRANIPQLFTTHPEFFAFLVSYPHSSAAIPHVYQAYPRQCIDSITQPKTSLTWTTYVCWPASAPSYLLHMDVESPVFIPS